MKLLLIKAVAEAHPYNRFVDGLDAGLKALGHEPVISDQFPHVVNGAASPNPMLGELQAARYDGLLSFNSFFGGVTLDNGASPYDVLGVKFVGWQLDHPIYAPQSLARALRNRHAVYSNHNHLRFAEALNLPGRGRALLAGGEPSQAPLKDHASRANPIFLAATFNGEPQALWEQMEDSAGKRLLEGVVVHLLAEREASLIDAFNATSQALGLGASLGADPAFDDQMIEFLREPLTYVRNVDRNRIVRALVDSGLPLTLCGWGWRGLLGERKNVSYIDDHIDFRALTALYDDAAIVINLNAGNGACERAIYAALAGAAVVSDHSEDLARQFTPGQDIAVYDRARPQSVVETVRDLIETAGRAEAMAARGRQRALTSGLWLHRAEALVEYLQAG